jgi:two-component system OmpR family sensor kinase
VSRFSPIGRLPLFLRIFALMLLTLLLVQVLNFAVVVLMPAPQPRITTLDQVAAALRGGSSDSRLRIRDGAIEQAAPAAMPPGPEAGLARLLARRLSLPDTAVRVQIRSPQALVRPLMLPGVALPGPRNWPARSLAAGPLPPGPPPAGAPPPGMEPRGDFVLIGDFAVSAQLGGRWRTVEPDAPGFAPWHRRTLIWFLVAMIVVAPVAWFLARGLARPIGLFAGAANRLGRNPNAPPLELSGPPEIRRATQAFNEMQGRLNRYVEDRTTLLAAIAHDLRTPLMRLNLRLEQAPAALREACEGDIGDMERMIATVMSFVRETTRPTRRQRLDLRSLAESVTDDFVDAGHAVRLAAGEPVILEGDATALKALLNNLVGNAVKYADGANLTLQIDEGNAIIEVIDDGPGLSADDLERAFEPFFRAERSRNRDTGGIGLGLASVRAVARAHGGDATLTNRPEGGLIARVSLPV